MAQELLDQLRLYDKAIGDWLVSCPVRDNEGNTPIIVMGPPNKSFAMAQEILKSKLGKDDAKKINQPYFPVIGYSRGDLTYAMERNFGLHRLRDMGIRLPDRKTRFTTTWPRPYDIPITIDVWTLTETFLDKWVVWLGMQSVSSRFKFYIDMSNLWSGWKTKLITAENQGLINNSDLEGVEEGRTAEKRYTLTMILKAWLILPIEESITVLRITQDTYIIPTGVDLGPLTVSDAEGYEDGGSVIYDELGWRKA